MTTKNTHKKIRKFPSKGKLIVKENLTDFNQEELVINKLAKANKILANSYFPKDLFKKL